GDFAMEAGAFGFVEEPRHLDEPRGRDGAHFLEQYRLAAAQLPDRFEDGEVGFASAVVLDALAIGGCIRRQLAEEGLDEAGFAYACITCDPYKLALAGLGAAPGVAELGECRFAAD